MGFLTEQKDGELDLSADGSDLELDVDTDSGSFLSDDDDSRSIDNQPDIYFHSSEDMREVDSNSVHLIVTSPPYNADWAYGSHDDDMDYQEEYLPMLARIFEECYRVLVPGGRMVVNIPSLLRGGTSGGQAIASDISTMLNTDRGAWLPDASELDSNSYWDITECMIETNFNMREFIVWDKEFNNDGLAPNGSFPRPWGILLNNFHEVALVFQKPGDRDVSDISDKRIEESKIDKWTDDLCDDVWTITPDNHEFKYVDDEDVPPFPEEFVKRCIAIWTYTGDTVLEPFAGRGTTLKMSKQMERESIGYEIRTELWRDIKEYVGYNQQTLNDII